MCRSWRSPPGAAAQPRDSLSLREREIDMTANSGLEPPPASANCCVADVQWARYPSPDHEDGAYRRITPAQPSSRCRACSSCGRDRTRWRCSSTARGYRLEPRRRGRRDDTSMLSSRRATGGGCFQGREPRGLEPSAGQVHREIECAGEGNVRPPDSTLSRKAAARLSVETP